MNVDIRLLGGFEVRLAGQAVPASAWSRRQAATLVKVLALAPRRRLHREQVMDALWPDVPVGEASPSAQGGTLRPPHPRRRKRRAAERDGDALPRDAGRCRRAAIRGAGG